MTIKLNKLNNTIIKCKKCPRLIKFIKKISVEKRKQNINENYWGKPVAGFGDFKRKTFNFRIGSSSTWGNKNWTSFYW
jgi:hypothetical protein